MTLLHRLGTGLSALLIAIVASKAALAETAVPFEQVFNLGNDQGIRIELDPSDDVLVFNGGIVVYSAALTPLIKSKHFVVTAASGASGAGGNPGQAGNPGNGGLGGAGAIGCGAGGSDGEQGGRTSGAQPGKAGSPGTAGTSLQESAP